MNPNSLHPHIVPLHASCSKHAWGSPAEKSLAARLYSLNRDAVVDSDTSYSEFIVSSVDPHQALLAKSPGVTLANHVQTQVIEVEASIVEFYSSLHEHGVPYVLRVLSVCSPQPLKVHPAPAEAKALSDSLGFKYPFACPLMSIAVSKAELLFGFRNSSGIVSELSRVPEFADCVGRPETDRFVHIVKTAKPKPIHIRELMSALFSRRPEEVADCLARASKRLLKMPKESVTDCDRYLIELQERFPSDPMCFAVYLLNRAVLEPGGAIFVHTQEPYCVLRGDILEIATLSDACVYGGLVEIGATSGPFISSLSFDDSPIEVSQGDRYSDFGVSYVPPVPYFQLLDFKLKSATTQNIVETLAPSLLLVLDGEGVISVAGKKHLLPLHAGTVLYLNPQTTFTVQTRADAKTDLRFVQVGVNESAAPSSSSSCSIM